MFNQFYTIPNIDILSVKWNDDPYDYDFQLYELGQPGKKSLVINPRLEEKNLIHYVKEIPNTDKCIVWHYEGDWVAKLFPENWTANWNSYLEIEIVKPKYVWKKNPDLDKLMQFENNPFPDFEPEPWDSKYELIWHIDPRFNPLDDKVWVMSARPIGVEIEGTKDMGYLIPKIEIEINPEVAHISFDINECYPNFYDLEYECVWELDPMHSPTEKMWAVKFTPSYRKPKDWKWYGTISPAFKVIYNSELPNLNYDLDYIVPYHDFEYEHIWMLDRKHLQNDEEDIWAFKITAVNKPIGSKIIDYISPTFDIEYNQTLPNLNYDLDYIIPWHDLKYEHMWLLDRKHLQNDEEDIWAFKISAGNNLETKIIDYISPKTYVKYNDDIPNLIYNIEYDIPWHDFNYVHVWMLDKKFADNKEDIWAIKIQTKETKKIKKIGIVTPVLEDTLDVIFISYNEPNAEKNWRRVLEKAPWAKRVQNIKGIFEAHKEAAHLSKTDMFYVVDGDAYLVDEWKFDFQPSIFDRDCAYVWSSKNPVNGLKYQNGGVKLFSKKILLSQESWNTLDMFTGIMPKIKTEKQISCITEFNTDQFSTWRSAVRECVKLYTTNQLTKLNTWLTKGHNRKFGKYAIEGAKFAKEFAEQNIDNKNELLKINDYDWLKTQFKKYYSNVRH